MDTNAALQNRRNTIQKIYDILHVIIIILSIYLVLCISFDTFNEIPFTESSYLKVQLFICSFFLLELFVEFFLSERKLHFFATHFFFLLISIPYLNIISYFHISLEPHILYLIQFVPLIRGGYALVNVVSWLTKSKASNMFLSYLIIIFSSVYFTSLMFFMVEQKVNPQVTNYGDSLWWAFMNVTTVGANIYAVTTAGKVMTVVLAALGMVTFPIFTVYFTSLVQRANKKKKNDLN